jgi:hypothetical protein
MKKINLIIKIAFTFLLASLVSFNLLVDKAMATGNFSQTCGDIEFNDSILTANCRKMNGSYNLSSIDVNPYIENVDGQLKWQPSNFIATCNTKIISGPFLEADCKTRDQRFVSTEIDLDEHIANIDGTLKFEK